MQIAGSCKLIKEDSVQAICCLCVLDAKWDCVRGICWFFRYFGIKLFTQNVFTFETHSSSGNVTRELKLSVLHIRFLSFLFVWLVLGCVLNSRGIIVDFMISAGAKLIF